MDRFVFERLVGAVRIRVVADYDSDRDHWNMRCTLNGKDFERRISVGVFEDAQDMIDLARAESVRSTMPGK